MTDTGYKAALAEAVAEARNQELQELSEQGDLFAQPGSAASGASLALVEAARGTGPAARRVQ